MTKPSCHVSLLAVCGVLLLATAAPAQIPERVDFQARLFGRDEVPPISEFGSGFLAGVLIQTAEETLFQVELEYPAGLGVTQAHIHFGQAGVNGGIMVFLCSNLPNPPAGTQPCPDGAFFDDPVTVTLTADDIIGPAAQGLPAGSFFEFQRALRQGVAYANIHSETFPGGVMRGQLRIIPEPQ